MSHKQDVIELVERYYIKRLTKMTGLTFHVDAKEHRHPDEATVIVVCDQSGYDPYIEFTGATWYELERTITIARHTERVMRYVERGGAEAIAD